MEGIMKTIEEKLKYLGLYTEVKAINSFNYERSEPSGNLAFEKINDDLGLFSESDYTKITIPSNADYSKIKLTFSVIDIVSSNSGANVMLKKNTANICKLTATAQTNSGSGPSSYCKILDVAPNDYFEFYFSGGTYQGLEAGSEVIVEVLR